MRAPVVSTKPKLPLVAMALLLACALAQPASADESELGDSPLLASLMGSSPARISAAVPLDGEGEPIVGSFTVDGLTYAIAGEGEVALASVDSDAAALAAGPAGVYGEGAADGSGPEGSQKPVVLALPESVEYDGAAYAVVAIGPRAFAGCEADMVTIPATVASVDELALRGSAIKAIEVADGNPIYSSYDGMLFDADMTSLLLIPEGKQGAARIPKAAEVVPADAFSHCASVTAIEADAGSAAFSSWNGCLYDAAGETLLSVPAGATEIEMADGCTTVAAGALEGCAKLRSIQAPASVAEVSPDVLGAAGAADGDGVPVASIGSLVLTAAEGSGLAAAAGADGDQVAIVGDAHDGKGGSVEGPQASSGGEGDGPVVEAEVPADDGDANPIQLTSLVALAAAGDGLPNIDLASITVRISEGADPAPWEAVGFKVEAAPADAADDAEPVEGEPLGDLVTDDAHDHDANETDGASSEGPVIVDEVTIGYGYANERSSADGAYERTIPKVGAVLKLQPIAAEELMEGEVDAKGEAAPAGSGPAADGGSDGADGTAASDAGSGDGTAADAAEGEVTLASKLADLPEESQAMASFLCEGCLYVIDPEGGAALVAVDPKRLADCVEDPTTLILPDYVDDGQWSYPLTRIAKGAFRGSGIERLWIPASATYLDYALEGCETLRYVEISEDSPVYSSKDGCLYDKSGETLWMMPEGSQGTIADDGYGMAEPNTQSLDSQALDILDKACLLNAIGSSASDTIYDENPPVFEPSSGRTSVYIPAGHTLNGSKFTKKLVTHGGHYSWAHVYLFSLRISGGPTHPTLELENRYSDSGWLECRLVVQNDVCDMTCSIRSISWSPNGPGATDAVVTSPYQNVYIRANDAPTATEHVTFDLGPCFEPRERSFILADEASLALRFPKNSLAEVTAWEVLPAGTTVTKPAASSLVNILHLEGQTYRAIYTRLAYKVKVHSNHSTDAVISELVVKPNTFLANLNPLPERPGYAFSGTSDSPEPGVGQAYHDKTGRAIQRWTRTDDGDIFCHWDPKTYRITYTSDDIGTDDSLRRTYETGEGFALPTPSRYGYLFDGWEVSGAQGAGVETVTEADGTKTTHIKAGTYGDLTCTAKWVLRYDLAVPIADPGDVTFEADSLTGQVRVKPGTSATGSIISYMAAPIMLDTLSCEGPHSAEPTDPAEGASELEGIFGVGASSKVRFVVTLGDADAAQTAKLTIGSASSLAGLAIPAATSRDDPGRMPVTYGLELDADLAIPPVRDAAPVAQLTYTVSLAP